MGKLSSEIFLQTRDKSKGIVIASETVVLLATQEAVDSIAGYGEC